MLMTMTLAGVLLARWRGSCAEERRTAATGVLLCDGGDGALGHGDL